MGRSACLDRDARIASSVEGSSRLERSPGSRPSHAARIARRMTLPDRVLGRTRVTATTSGFNGLPS